MDRLVTVRLEIEVAMGVQDPVMRSAETQVADFILPALDDLKEATVDVQSVAYKFTETPVVCSDDQFEDGVDTHNAVAFVLCHGGSLQVAEKFRAYCQQQADPTTAELNEYGTGKFDYLFEFCDIKDEEIVAELTKQLG